MKRFLMPIFTAVATMLASCTQVDIIEQEFDVVEAIAEVPNETDGFGETKSIVNETSSGLEMIWGTNESIGVYGNRLTNEKFTSTNKYYQQLTTTFKGGTLFTTPQYAYYPYNSDNNSNPVTAVKGNIPQTQYFSTIHKKMNTDYKIGEYSSKSWTNYSFNFYHILTFLRFIVNADNTVLEGDELQKITLTITDPSGHPRQMTGNFTFDLTKSSENAITSWDEPTDGANSLTLVWSDYPILSRASTFTGYLSAAPRSVPGDILHWEIVTDKHIARFTRTSKATFKPNGIIKYTLTLSNFPDMVVEEIPVDVPSQPETPAVGTHPVLHSMKFTVADNPGKILGRKLESSNYKTVSKTRTEEVCTVDTTNHTISLYLPYLNNRKLVPVFEIPEGTQLFYEGGEIISGETEVDFATYKQVAVVNEVGDGVIYDINFTNTGLPVVVVNQKSGIVTSDNGEYKGGSAAWYSATGTGWQPKDSDWLMVEGDDNFMVYNADGTSAITDKNGATVNEPLLASTRVRGNVSQKMPKKPFAVKLDKKSGIFMNDSDQSNDLPAHKRWVLLANWSDRTLMRNAIAFGIADIFKQTFPTDGIAWNPSGQFVELVYNGVHVGNYYLCEQVKIDGNRLDIADPYDKDDAYSGNAADYGYLLECDDAYDEAVKFMSKHYIPFQFKDDADANGEMLSYASTLVRGVEDKLYNKEYSTAYETLDMTSMVDFLLIQELMMNGEISHPKSSYMYIDGGRLYAGPIWDFDWETIPYISEINSKYDNAYTSEDYVYEYNKSMIASAKHYRKSSGYPTKPYESSSWFSSSVDYNYLWYPMLVKDSDFTAEAARRWNMVKGALTAYADVQVPAMASKIRKSEAENWSMWQFESGSSAPQKRHSTYGVGGGFKGDEHLSFDEAVKMLTTNLNNRINGMSYVSNQSWPSITIQNSSK